MKKLSVLLVFLLNFSYIFSQINYTANDAVGVAPYTGNYLFGSNMGWYGSSWDDETIADIAAGNAAKNVIGVGVKTLRPSLYEDFLETWGYDIRLNAFAHYANLGITDNTVFLGLPASAAHKDNNKYGGCADESMLFKNLYEPIWDGGLNGTPVNENNYYALYVYKTVIRYKQGVKFWEIVNEPDLNAWNGNAWKSPGNPGNWWENTPSPCEFENMKAPVYHYIRMLRISYEVIKTIDPTAFITTGGIGYASFLDLLLRNTDNPVDGSVTSEYPNKGGAYFDCLSFHSYPIFDLNYWDNTLQKVVYTRHSDASLASYTRQKKSMDSILAKHGYAEGNLYPKKVVICTENNIPGKAIDNYIGGAEVQRNYIIKAIVQNYKMGVRQMYIYGIGNDDTYADATNPWHVMGLYQKLPGIGPLTNNGIYSQQYTDEGIAYKTSSDILMWLSYDAQTTTDMALPANINGAAFTNGTGNYVYVLWAKTSIDSSEVGNAVYNFPAAVNVTPTLYKKDWNFFVTQNTSTISSNNIALTGSPVFLSSNFTILPYHHDSIIRPIMPNVLSWSLYPNPTHEVLAAKFSIKQKVQVSMQVFNTNGQMVWSAIPAKQLVAGQHIIPLSIPAILTTGMYYCKIQFNEKVAIEKLIINK